VVGDVRSGIGEFVKKLVPVVRGFVLSKKPNLLKKLCFLEFFRRLQVIFSLRRKIFIDKIYEIWYI